MDHSGGDELTGVPEAIHSTAVLMSENGASLTLAESIKPEIKTQGGLGKWSKRGPEYRQQFIEGLIKVLPQSGAFLFGFSARESTINANKDLIVSELGFSEKYSVSTDKKGRQIWSFQPVKNQEGEIVEFVLRESQVMMLLWISHFLARGNKEFFAVLEKSRTDLNMGVLDLFMNKFANDGQDRPGCRAFLHLALSNFFQVRSITFVETNGNDAEMVVDNLAGLLRDHALHPLRYPSFPRLLATGFVHYESTE